MQEMTGSTQTVRQGRGRSRHSVPTKTVLLWATAELGTSSYLLFARGYCSTAKHTSSCLWGQLWESVAGELRTSHRLPPRERPEPRAVAEHNPPSPSCGVPMPCQADTQTLAFARLFLKALRSFVWSGLCPPL